MILSAFLLRLNDTTNEQFSYQRANGQKILDLTHFKDREGRWTLFGYDALRQRTASIDPLGRVTRFHWCYCGALQDLWDAEGNKTHWDYDFTERLTKKTYADGKETSYTYQPLSGWLSTITDALGQVKTHSYFPDGNLQGIAYTNTQQPTPNVGFTYDPIYGRLATMTDGTGTTSYAYHPVDGCEAKPRRGAHAPPRVVFGALAVDRLVRSFHEVSDEGVGNNTQGRVCSPKTLTAPNGLTTTLDYHPAAADLRLKEIKHTRPGNVALSKHVYGYKPAGNIESWAHTLGTNAAKTWAIAYDKADQLEAATQTQSGAVTAQQAFRFDRIGNITGKQDGSEISKGTFNNRNQLTAQEPGGWMRVRGTTNEGASVRVKSNANPFTNAATTSADEFSAWVQAAPGANTVTVEAKDDSPNANTRTKSWSVNITGQSRVPTYDANGNQITGYILPLGSSSLVSCVYSWDAENRLVKITYADNSKTEFTYDGLSRRVRITERNAGNTITGDKRYLWAGGNQPAEEREANGTTVTKRYFPQGEQRIGGSDAGFYYYTKDHLGSIREITNSSGALATRYDFDLWGKRTKLSGSMETDVGFTGHHHHAKSGLVLTWFRAYDADAGRWLSPDPLGESGGMNLYGYVGGNPVNFIDPLGLENFGAPFLGIKPPNFTGDNEWNFSPDKSGTNDRGGVWKCKKTGMSASWDLKDSHWDVDDGQSRQRYSRWGIKLTPGQAHNPPGPRRGPLMSKGAKSVGLLGGVLYFINGSQQAQANVRSYNQAVQDRNPVELDNASTAIATSFPGLNGLQQVDLRDKLLEAGRAQIAAGRKECE